MRRWAPIVLVVASVVVAILATEVVYRVMRRFVCVGTPSVNVWRMDDRYGWGHKPHGEGWLWGCVGRRYEWRAYTRINAHGLRDREHAYEKPAGTRRVLLLGDSITEAMQVPLEATFATRLEGALDRPERPVEVINAGVAGFGTDNALAFFRAEGVRYEPDVVVLVFNVVNDLVENSPVLHARMYAATPERLLPKTYYELDAAGRLERIPPAPRPRPTVAPMSWWDEIEHRVYLVRALRRLAPRSAPPPAAPPVDLTIYEVTNTRPGPEWERSWAVTEALVRALRDEVVGAGARFAVAVMPFRESVVPLRWLALLNLFPTLARTPHDPSYPVDRMTAFLARAGIPHLSLLPALRSAAERTGTSGFPSLDVHLDPTGHARVAETLAPFVSELLETAGGTG